MSVGTVLAGVSAAGWASRLPGGGDSIGADRIVHARAPSGPAPDAVRRLYERTVGSLQRIADGLNPPGAQAAPRIEQMIDRQDLERVASMDSVLQGFKQRFPNGSAGLLNLNRQANDEAFRLKVELVGASIEFDRAWDHLNGMMDSPSGDRAAVARVESARLRLLGVRQGIDAFDATLRQAIRSAVPPRYL